MAQTVALAHDLQGSASSSAAILLHGFPLDRTMWDDQMPILRELGYRVLRPDLPGHGASPLLDGPTTMEATADAVIALADRLGIERFLLMGFSVGGYIALDLVRRHPTRVSALVLVDTRAEPDDEAGRTKRAETAASVRRDGVGVLEKAMVPKLLSADARERHPQQLSRVTAMIRRTTVEGAARVLEGMAARPDQRPRLSAIQVPTLIVVGSLDELTPPDASRAMAKAIPGSRLEVIDGAAHLVPVEASERFNGALAMWVRSFRPH